MRYKAIKYKVGVKVTLPSELIFWRFVKKKKKDLRE